MIEKAIAKLKAEMAKDKDGFVQVIGDFLIQHVKANPESAEKILTEGKTISKSLDEMASVARKKAVKGRATLSDQEGFEIVLKYFGISGQAKATAEETISTPKVQEVRTVANDIDFDVKLEDFI